MECAAARRCHGLRRRRDWSDARGAVERAQSFARVRQRRGPATTVRRGSPGPSSATRSSSTLPTRRAVTTMRPASDRRAMPWRTAFSTRCWIAKLGTAAESSASGRRRSPDADGRRSAPARRRDTVARARARRRATTSLSRDRLRLRAQHFRQLLDDARRRRVVAVAHEHVHRVQTIEQKVRVELRLERGQPRAGELLGQPRTCDSRSRAPRRNSAARARCRRSRDTRRCRTGTS